MKTNKIRIFVAIGVAMLLTFGGMATAVASALDFSVLNLTAPYSLTIEAGHSANITVHASVTGKQNNAASFDIWTSYERSSVWIKTASAHYDVAPRPVANDPATTFDIPCTVSIPAGTAAGDYSLTIESYNITTTSPGALAPDNSPPVITVHVTNPTLPADTTPPTITAPADVAAEAIGEYTAVEIGEATASDDSGHVTVTNNAPSTFPLGDTTVTWTATDPSGNTATATQMVTVSDTTAPVFTFVPADITKEATDILTPVDIGLAAATDAFNVTITNDAPVDGFPYGATTVTWTATDVHGNSRTAEQTVTITDTTDPVFTSVPLDIVQEATARLSPVDIGSSTAWDIFDVTVTNDAPSGGFPYGDTDVTWTATDEHGNSSTATQKVTITDTTDPVFTYVPGPVTVILNGPVNLGQATAEDIFDVTVTNDAPATFPIGTTIVTWTATDEHGNTATATQSVTVKYNFIGILQPINMDGSSVFKAGSTVPVKFQLKDFYGAYITNAVANISLNKYSNSVLGDVVEAASTSAATTGTLFRYDTSANQYIFNLSTKGLSSGTYLLAITLNDGAKQTVKISLK